MSYYENPQSISYIIKEGDTLESIWQKYSYLSSWKVLAEFNQLEYPYIVPDDTDIAEPASGQVVFSWKTPSATDVLVPAGTLVGCLQGSHTYQYLTQESVVLSADQSTSDPVLIASVDCGKEFNLASQAIDTIFDTTLSSLLTVTNPAPLSGGFQLHVKRYGDILYIPTQHSSETRQTPIDFINVYGIDIYAGDNLSGEYGLLHKSGTHDLLLVAGLDNLKQALIRRVTTDEGSLLGHPTYGSRFSTYLGKALTYQVPEMLKVEAVRCLKGDPRVKEVPNVDVTLYRDTAHITCSVLTYTDENLLLQFDIG